MKASYKMYFSAKNMAKVAIILFIVFQVMTVIVTMERYKHLENKYPTEFGARIEKGTDATRGTENVSDATFRTTTAETSVHSRNENVFADTLRKLMEEKLGLIPKVREREPTTQRRENTSDRNHQPEDLELHEKHQTDHTSTSQSSTSEISRFTSSTTEKSHAEHTTHEIPASISRPTFAPEKSKTRGTTLLLPIATTARSENKTEDSHKRRKHSSLTNIFLKVLQSMGKRLESKALEEKPETTTQTFSLKGLLTFSSEYDTEGVIRSAGYPVETHKVRTEDGYILTVHRIPPRYPHLRPAHAAYLPVFLQHGLWSSSYHWFEDKPQYTLPLLLSDKGYDVWLGNSRGNVISQEHVSLPIDTNSSYWDFSFHEMGIYDLPAVIDHILAKTKKPQIHYIGHSMGTTMFFVMASLRPEVATKVHFMMALAPIATVGPIRSFFRWILLLEKFFMTREKPVAYLARVGVSLKTMLHYMQLYVTGKFEMYDYGKIANMDIYKSPVPPSYDLAKVSVPTVLCYGTKDTFLTSDDIETLDGSLGNSLGVWPLPLNHFQFPSGKFTKEVLYKYIPLHLH